MTTTELMAHLAGQGFTLAPEGADIRIRPSSRLTPELRSEIRNHKSELLALITGQVCAGPSPQLEDVKATAPVRSFEPSSHTNVTLLTDATASGDESASPPIGNGHAYEFRLWERSMGRVCDDVFSFDCETTRIDDVQPWATPEYVLGVAFDGRQGYYVHRHDVAAFFGAHESVSFALHNAAFDLAVIHALAPQIDIYDRVEKNLVWDTQLLHRLYVLGDEGHAARGKGESTLDHCANRYLKINLPKDVTDSNGEPVRLSYAKWLNRPVQEIEQVYLEYLAKDAIVTRLLCEELRQLLDRMLAVHHDVWGFVSPEWLTNQVHRWGPQTHHIQLRASIVLKEITANGLHLDVARRTELAQALEVVLTKKREALQEFDYRPGGKGSANCLQEIMKRLEAEHAEVMFHRTANNKYSTTAEDLQDLADTVPFVRLLLEYRETAKLLSSFVNKMGKHVLHPSFNVLARTGRTTSFGDINAQNLPTDDMVRSCFVPSPGNVFLDADYKTIELATLAQACVGQFGLDSRMAAAINAGQDLHNLVAGRVLNKPVPEVTKDERKKAKPINFGKPGGMGDATMKQYAMASYGIHLDDQEVAALSSAWFDLFPEMRDFLADTNKTPQELAALLNLTPSSHYEHTGDPRFVRHPENAGRETEPDFFLGCMLMKTVKSPNPETVQGKPYSPADLDYFWSHLEAKMAMLTSPFRKEILARRPSVRLQREVMSLVGRASVFTFTGRLRANATYCARHNTVFQGLAADGAKLALWRLWRAGYRIANFIHDQVLIEVPSDSDLKQHAERICSLMIEGMRAVVPDIRVEVSFAATDRWYKDAEAVFDEAHKRLLLWQPKPASA